MRLLTKEETPQGWDSKSISFYVEKHKGGAPLRPTDFSETGFSVIPKKAIQSGSQLIINNPTYCTSEFAKNNERSIVDSSYTITTLRDLVPAGPTIGTVVNYSTNAQYILSQGVYGLKLKDSIDRNYFAYMSNTSFYRKVMRRVMVGSTQVHIRTPEYLKLEIQTPPLTEQRKISKIINTWDKAISTTERLIDNSKQQKKALMQQLLTGKKRLIGDSGKPFTDKWEEVYLGDVITHKKGYAFKSASYAKHGTRIIRISDTNRNSIHDTSPVFINENNEDDLNSFRLSTGNILLSTVGSRPHLLDSMVGKVIQVPKKDDGALLNQNLVKLSPKTSVIANSYLYIMLKKSQFIYFISILVRGNANQVSITLKELFNYKFLLPTLEEQQKITAVIINADKEIELLEQQLADLKQEKKALMQQLLTGKRRVKIN